MKFLMGQINTTPNDFEGNLQQILQGVEIAGKENCKLAVFPELSVPGYLVQDLMFDQNFVERNYDCVGIIREASKAYPELRIVVGCIDQNTKGIGKPFWNMAIMIKDGHIKCRYKKQLLPFYDVFDEGRYFEPGKDTTIFEIDGVTFGMTICEDLWNDKEQEENHYISNPVQQYRDLKVDCLINISSSPYCKKKPKLRQRIVDEVSKSFEKGVIYVNQIGGQDELVFDGCSTYTQHTFQNLRGVRHRKILFPMDSAVGARDSSMATYCVQELDPKTPVVDSRDFLSHGMKYVKNMLVMGLRDYLNKSGFDKVVIGSSGGIDSALVIALAADAIGPENVHAIMMPSIHSSDHSLSDAKELHKNVGCNEYEVPISHLPVIDMLKEKFSVEDYHPVADENIQARTRGQYVMWFSNALNALPLTTGNKTELAIGYATLYGDMCGGFAPICDLYKMEVYKIARQLYGHWIPENIIDKQPSAELAEGQFDANELLEYEILDRIVEEYIENNIHTHKDFMGKVLSETDYDVAGNKYKVNDFELCLHEYNKMIRKVDNNEFKRRQYAPGTKVSRKSFGIGRRVPIVKGRKTF